MALRRSGDDPALLSTKEGELASALLQELNPLVLYQLIDENAQSLSLPMEILSLIFHRFNELGERTPKVLEWYASMIKFYGDPTEWTQAEELIEEARSLRARI